MAILKIARMGHPILQTRARPVTNPTAPEIKSLVSDMLETMIDANGAGLAAPQVHVAKRVVIFVAPDLLGEDQAEDGLVVLINPVIEPLQDPENPELPEDWEGCLSVPGMRGLVPRHRRIRYQGYDLNGQVIDRVAEGFHARVVQHECDHLDGYLYPQRMTDLRNLVFESELRHHRSQGEVVSE